MGRDALRRLYWSIAEDRLDEGKVDEVGLTLLLRCRAILDISEARRGRVRCPVCERRGEESMIQRKGYARAEVLRCERCGWEIVWADYLRSFKRRQFNEGGAGPAFRRFVESWSGAATPWQKMLAIDLLIHEFHYSLRDRPEQPTRAICVNLIDGKLADVVSLLNEIFSGLQAGSEMAERHAAWQVNCRRAGQWHPT